MKYFNILISEYIQPYVTCARIYINVYIYHKVT